jgi:hypothetical protein
MCSTTLSHTRVVRTAGLAPTAPQRPTVAVSAVGVCKHTETFLFRFVALLTAVCRHRLRRAPRDTEHLRLQRVLLQHAL